MNTASQILYFRVAGIVFSVDFRYEGNPRRLLPSYKKFYLPDYQGEADMKVVVGPNETDDQPEGVEMGQFDTGGTVHGVFRLDDGGYKFQLRNLSHEIVCAVRSDARFTNVRATLYGHKNYHAFGLNNAVMICFAYCAAYHHTLLIHSSVVKREDRAYLFLGKSGTGKSTHTQLWIRHLRGSRLLNDDNPAIRVEDDGTVNVYGTPWSGKTPCYNNEHAPIGAIVRLEQWKENIIEREPVIKAFASILSSCSTMMWDKQTYSKIQDTCTAVVSKVPCYYLRNLPNEDAANLSYNTISQRV